MIKFRSGNPLYKLEKIGNRESSRRRQTNLKFLFCKAFDQPIINPKTIRPIPFCLKYICREIAKLAGKRKQLRHIKLLSDRL